MMMARFRWTDYERISIHLKRAIIIAEDAKFVDHEGFDWEGIQRALEKNQRRGKVVAGGSTITQQLAKNLFLSGDRSLLRKGQEAILASMLEATMSKRRIFEIYLNVVEWGENVFGAEAAARYYFGADAGALEPEQAARLAAMLPRPRYYDRNRDSPYLTGYADSILTQMYPAQIPKTGTAALRSFCSAPAAGDIDSGEQEKACHEERTGRQHRDAMVAARRPSPRAV